MKLGPVKTRENEGINLWAEMSCNELNVKNRDLHSEIFLLYRQNCTAHPSIYPYGKGMKKIHSHNSGIGIRAFHSLCTFWSKNPSLHASCSCHHQPLQSDIIWKRPWFLFLPETVFSTINRSYLKLFERGPLKQKNAHLDVDIKVAQTIPIRAMHFWTTIQGASPSIHYES